MLRARCSALPHFTDEETKASKGAQGHTAVDHQWLDLNEGLTLESLLFSHTLLDSEERGQQGPGLGSGGRNAIHIQTNSLLMPTISHPVTLRIRPSALAMA